MIVYVRVSMDDKQSLMVDGVFSTLERGMAGIGDRQGVVPFDLAIGGATDGK